MAKTDNHFVLSGNCPLALEANIMHEEIADTLRSHPRFYKEPDVLRLLLAVQAAYDKTLTAHENELTAMYESAKEEGVTEGRADCLSDYFEEVDSAAYSLADLLEAKGKRPSQEVKEAIAELKEILGKMEKEYRK